MANNWVYWFAVLATFASLKRNKYGRGRCFFSRLVASASDDMAIGSQSKPFVGSPFVGTVNLFFLSFSRTAFFCLYAWIRGSQQPQHADHFMTHRFVGIVNYMRVAVHLEFALRAAAALSNSMLIYAPHRASAMRCDAMRWGAARPRPRLWRGAAQCCVRLLHHHFL